MQSAKELFTHELGDILDAENRILGIIDETLEQTQNPQMQKALEQHRRQTEVQIERLERCFEVLGEEAEQTECKGIMGLKQEKEEFMEEEPAEEVLEAFNLGATIKVEHYEIAAYTSLMGMAQKLGMTKAAKLLGQNLREEQQMLKKTEAVEKKFKPTATGMTEEEEGGMEMVGASRSRSRSGSRSSSRSSGSSRRPSASARSNSRGNSRSRSRRAA
jgi:ferritin-like metal-binding protein YciE